MVPGLLQIVKGESTILGFCLLTLDGVLGPYALTVDELGVPGLDVTEEVWDQLVLLVGHACSEVRDALLSLLGVPQISLWNQYMPH